MADGVNYLWRLVGQFSGRTGCGADRPDPSTGLFISGVLAGTAKLAFGWIDDGGNWEVRTLK